MARIPEIITPQKVVKAMVDMLPEEVWNSHTVFLDPACKGGEYLKEIYDRLMETESIIAEYPNQFERSNHILLNQLYGIALSQVSLERTTKKLLGCGTNIRVIPDYINKLKGINLGSRPDGSQNNILDILNKEFGRNMRFDVVIGNPPYQESTGGGGDGRQGMTLYTRFIDMACKCSQIICMITKNNWISSDSLTEIRNIMLKNGITHIHNYPVPNEVFKGVSVSVCSFCIDKNNKGYETNYVETVNGKDIANYNGNFVAIGCIPPSQYAYNILRKIKLHQSKSFGDRVLGKMAFGINSNGRLGATGTSPYIDESIIRTDDYDIGVMYLDGKEPRYTYTNIDNISSNRDIIDKYKIVCGHVLNRNENVITNIRGVNPHVVTSASYATIYYCDNKEEAYNVYKYVKSRFFRAIVYFSIDTKCDMYKERLKFVPLQDFTPSSDIDWSQSVADIDKQLYAKYNLTQEEIDYIEATIKPME